ncbi:MAG: deoxyribodipyrimidine photolyase [Candidatus Izimaplasma sp.]|nr:deoxyribodipyrimidine photolyase [Candidatus Izimaplasma bacterium]
MNEKRVIHQENTPEKVSSLLYIMSSDFRVENNHALYHSYNLAKKYSASLHIVLLKEPEENDRNNTFFEHGIKNYKQIFDTYADDVSHFSSFNNTLKKVIKKADLIIKDKGYLLEEKAIEKELENLISDLDIGLEYVESNTLVPVTVTSNKEEYNARTIRKKIHENKDAFIDPVFEGEPDLTYAEKAMEIAQDFVSRKLKKYHLKNDPSLEYTSNLSPYLKYGFISPLTIIRLLFPINNDNKEDYFEELVVRRELAYNFIFFNEKYNQFDHMTYGWAYDTMEIHLGDKREYIYTKDDYTSFNTHDPYFNAAMKEMVHLGKMHTYMRMYWCKKILEWSPSYKEAYKIALDLNNYYFLDGNTPNGYTGVAWCFGKHDRAWKEREIFGKIRYMNANGLKRKFDIEEYVKHINKETEQS